MHLICHLDRSEVGRSAVTANKPQISPLRFAPVEMTKVNGVTGCRLCNPMLHFCPPDLTLPFFLSFPKGICFHYFRRSNTEGKPQISPLRFAPVEMTKVNGVTGCRLCNPMLHFCPPDLTLPFFLSFPKGICFHYSRRSNTEGKPQISPLRFAPVEMTKVNGVTGCRLCNPMLHFCPPDLTLPFFLSFPKGICFHYSRRSNTEGKPQISPLRFAPVEMTKVNGVTGCRLCNPMLHFCPPDLTLPFFLSFPKGICFHYFRRSNTEGKPQISPLRFAPVEMTKVNGVTGCRLCNPMLHFCPPDLTLPFFLSFPKGICFHYSRRSNTEGKPQISPLRFAPVEMTKL